ncbi:MAG: nucleotidyltransferase family protein, partial [Nanoarchaeota archaeon]|nr:nucleotidyltransferase family protein [Nanoarchaeota archaeon]
MIEQAVILAAGKGKRMKKNTTDPVLLNTPKPLLKVKGISLIENKIKPLIEKGVDVVVVINKDDEKAFKEALKDYPIKFVYQGNETGTAASLYSSKELINKDMFLVLMGDDLIDYDTDSVLNLNEPTVFAAKVEDVSNYGAIVTNEENEVIDILEKKKSGEGLANTGIYVMPKEFFEIYNEIPVDEKSGEKFLTEAIWLLRKKGIKFKVKTIKRWIGINTPEELKKAE